MNTLSMGNILRPAAHSTMHAIENMGQLFAREGTVEEFPREDP